MDLIGRTLGSFTIKKKLGSGGMADVYYAHQARLDRAVALKVLSPELARRPGFQERFEQEARAAANLNHPNILTIYDYGHDPQTGSTFIAMELVAGETLTERMIDPLETAQILALLLPICDALALAHEQGIFHRDIKPSNILIASDGRPLLADFGLVWLGERKERITESGFFVGSPEYMAPEQASGDLVDGRADQYSLGIVLYEMLTGQLPFQATNVIGLISQHVHTPMPDPRLLRPDLSPGVVNVLFRATAKDPKDRFSTITDFAHALQIAFTQPSSSTLAVSKLREDGASTPAHLFISYVHGAGPDQELAAYLSEFLAAQGHDVFIDITLRTGDLWVEQIDRQIKASDFLIVLLSQRSADSEMVQAEIRRAYKYRRLQGHPHTLPVRIAYEGLLPYTIDAFLDPLQYVVWQSDADTERVGRDILAAIEGRLPARTPIQAMSVTGDVVISEDGRIISNEVSLHPPLPEFDPRFLEELEAPGGAVRLRDRFYVERDADARLKREVVRSGTITTIRAPRQAGKSSLLVRGVHHARQNGARVVSLNLQRVDRAHLDTADAFFRYLAEFIVRQLRLDGTEVEKAWRSSLGPQDKLTYLMEDYVLPAGDAPIVLALDEVDRLLQTTMHNDFFALLRSWYESRTLDERWNRLSIVMVISTEPYLLIASTTQSPFNVGLRLYLKDFTEAQTRGLNRQHGSPVKDEDLHELGVLLGGHPYLTRKALYVLVTEQLSWAELVRVAATDQGPFGDHLRRYHWLLRDEADLKSTIKAVIQRGECADDAAFFRLLRAGLVKGSEDACACRCDLYRRYFGGKL
jgi:serine/threonine protein kinase